MKKRQVHSLLIAGVPVALIAAGVLLLCQGAVAGEAVVAPKAKVIIVTMGSCCPSVAWPEAEEKVAVELTSQDIRVERIDGVRAGDQKYDNQLAAVLNDEAAVATLRITRASDGVAVADLLYRDRQTDKTVSKHLTFNPMPGEESIPIAALKIVELLSAGALELAIPPASAAPLQPPDEMVSPEQSGPSVALKLGAGASLAPGNATLLPAGFLAIDVSVRKRLSLEGEVSLSLPGRTLPVANTKLDFYEGSLRCWALWELVNYKMFTGTVGGGGGVVFVEAEGHTALSHKGVDDLAWTGYTGATSRLSAALTESVQLGLAINVGATLPKMEVWYAPNESVNFGWPFVEAAIVVGAQIR